MIVRLWNLANRVGVQQSETGHCDNSIEAILEKMIERVERLERAVDLDTASKREDWQEDFRNK